MSQWYDNSKATEKLIVTILPAVAKALGDGWEQGQADADGDHDWRARHLYHADGRVLCFGVAQGKGDRICVSGGWPRSQAGEVLTPSYSLSRDVREGKVTEITVATTKSPVQIAADISRRLLPDYTTLYRLLLDRAAEYDGHRARLLATARSAAALFGVREGWEGYLSRTFSQIRLSGPYGSGVEDIDCHEHTVTLKITVDLETAATIASLLKR